MRRALVAAIPLLIVTGFAPRADAYPQWQFSSGTSRCQQCHFAPGGGGLPTGYGRDAAGEELSTWAGSGAFLHGAAELPSFLALGFDGRMAFLAHDDGGPDGRELAYFPMQADASARVAFTQSLSILGTVGVRGQARSSQEVADDNFHPAELSRLIAREYYLMWRPAALGPYVRVGRYFAPYGLRLAEHYTYVRQDLGFNLLEETHSASFGIVQNEWELHATAFAPDWPRGLGGRERGGSVMAEVRIADSHALGAQSRVGFHEDMDRYAGGLFAKSWVAPANLLLQAEGNLVHLRPADGTSNMLVGYLGATLFPVRGVWLTGFVERQQTDLTVKDSATNAGGAQLNWFPYPHFEFVVLGRVQRGAGATLEDSVKTVLGFLHYWL